MDDPAAPRRRGLLFVVSAPSGTGKTTVAERLVQVVPDLSLSRSYTSRPARAGEATVPWRRWASGAISVCGVYYFVGALGGW